MVAVLPNFPAPGTKAQFVDAKSIIKNLKNNQIPGMEYFHNEKISELVANRFANKIMNDTKFELQLIMVMCDLIQGVDASTEELIPKIDEKVCKVYSQFLQKVLLDCAKQI